jgi:AraC family transcriptional regulator
MVSYRLIERPAIPIVGKKTWIAGPDNESFGRFWAECAAQGVMARLEQLSGFRPGAQTGGISLGVSRVEQNPAKRAFHYMIAVERPAGVAVSDLECYEVPASQWAVFECRGQVPQGIVAAEMYAFMEWLPMSGFVHALAPEMEVYLPGDSTRPDYVCEFWLPIISKA